MMVYMNTRTKKPISPKAPPLKSLHGLSKKAAAKKAPSKVVPTKKAPAKKATPKPTVPKDPTNNDRARAIFDATGLDRQQILDRINETIGVRKLSLSALKGYMSSFDNGENSRWRRISDDLLRHIEIVFGK